MKYVDGTTARDKSKWKEEFTPERREWLEEALKHYMKDFTCRMTEIKEALDKEDGVSSAAEGDTKDQDQEDRTGEAASTSLEQQELLLEELMEIVEHIDCARDLHKIGGLPTLMELLRSRHPSLRWRAAEVAATCMQNNEPVQQWFLEGSILPQLMTILDDEDATWFLEGSILPQLMTMLDDEDATVRVKPPFAMPALRTHPHIVLLPAVVPGGQHPPTTDDHWFLEGSILPQLMSMLDDKDATVRVKALFAMSCLIRNFQPGMIKFRELEGLSKVAQRIVKSEHRPETRKSILLLQHILTGGEQYRAQDAAAMCELPGLLTKLVGICQHSLVLQLEIARSSSECWAKLKAFNGVVESAQAMVTRHATLDQEDKDAEEDELQFASEHFKLLTLASPPAVDEMESKVEVSTEASGSATKEDPVLLLGP
eukprot:gene4829-34575_t